ncbi:MAG: SH3 domain-containing protein [Desulfobulbaceae bacterium]|nr:SH3 domain-containing protein [Desulfobulbaceae bacterium]
MKYLRLNFIFIFTLFLITFLFQPIDVFAKMVSIVKENINMRSGPGTKYQVKWKLGKGYPLIIVSQKGKWLNVKDFEGDTGWVYRTLTDTTPHLVVKRKKVNVRSGPGEKYGIISEAKYGVVFETLKKKGGFTGWVEVKHEKTGITGWIRRDLLWGW